MCSQEGSKFVALPSSCGSFTVDDLYDFCLKELTFQAQSVSVFAMGAKRKSNDGGGSAKKAIKASASEAGSPAVAKPDVSGAHVAIFDDWLIHSRIKLCDWLASSNEVELKILYVQVVQILLAARKKMLAEHSSVEKYLNHAFGTKDYVRTAESLEPKQVKRTLNCRR